MKPNNTDLINQRKIMNQKLKAWLQAGSDQKPPSGWIKAIRRAMGISTQQVADRLGISQSAVAQFEKAEAHGKASLETIEKAARAMRCKLIYAIVPEDEFDSLDAILNAQALQAARILYSKVDHSMRLEKQGLTPDEKNGRIKEFALELKARMDPSLWSLQKLKKDK